MRHAIAYLKQLGRMTILRTIVHQIEAYKDMITPVVDVFKYLTQLKLMYWNMW